MGRYWFCTDRDGWQDYGEKYDNEVYVLPSHLGEEVVRLYLHKIGAKLTKLRKEQARYINVNGPYKAEHYRY